MHGLVLENPSVLTKKTGIDVSEEGSTNDCFIGPDKIKNLSQDKCRNTSGKSFKIFWN